MTTPHASILHWIKKHYPTLSFQEKIIYIDISQQLLYLIDNQKTISHYPISSSKHGVGNIENSYQTPTGLHKVAEKIGAECQLGEILKARISTGEIAELNSEEASKKDFITSRILWLEGLEPEINLGMGVDTYRRFIYIHGTADETSIGTPASIGCVRMKNQDIITLFTRVGVDTPVILKA